MHRKSACPPVSAFANRDRCEREFVNIIQDCSSDSIQHLLEAGKFGFRFDSSALSVVSSLPLSSASAE